MRSEAARHKVVPNDTAKPLAHSAYSTVLDYLFLSVGVSLGAMFCRLATIDPGTNGSVLEIVPRDVLLGIWAAISGIGCVVPGFLTGPLLTGNAIRFRNRLDLLPLSGMGYAMLVSLYYSCPCWLSGGHCNRDALLSCVLVLASVIALGYGLIVGMRLATSRQAWQGRYVALVANTVGGAAFLAYAFELL